MRATFKPITAFAAGRGPTRHHAALPPPPSRCHNRGQPLVDELNHAHYHYAELAWPNCVCQGEMDCPALTSCYSRDGKAPIGDGDNVCECHTFFGFEDDGEGGCEQTAMSNVIVIVQIYLAVFTVRQRKWVCMHVCMCVITLPRIPALRISSFNFHAARCCGRKRTRNHTPSRLTPRAQFSHRYE